MVPFKASAYPFQGYQADIQGPHKTPQTTPCVSALKMRGYRRAGAEEVSRVGLRDSRIE